MSVTTSDKIKLTSFSHGAGCACKLSLDTLGEVLAFLGPQADPSGVEADVRADILVGLDEADDAAVIRLDEKESLILTLDFFTPLVTTPTPGGASRPPTPRATSTRWADVRSWP